jgi:hypothetical protein
MAIEAWFRTTSGAAQTIMSGIVNTGAEIRLALDTLGKIKGVTTTGISGTVDYQITTPEPYNDGSWHHAVLAETVSGGTVTGELFVDGVSKGTATRSATTVFGVYTLVLQTQVYPSFQNPFFGNLARVAVYGNTLTAARIVSHWLSSFGFAGERTGDRVARILGWTPWVAGSTSISPGVSFMGSATNLNGSVTNALDLCITTEGTAFVPTGDGTLTFLDRNSYYSQISPTVTLGENTAGGEIPYTGNIGWDIDPSFMYNEITITRTDQDSIVQTTSNPGSQRRYFTRPLSITVNSSSDLDALYHAQHLATVYGNPHFRVSSLTLDPGSNPAIWTSVLNIKFGDRVRVVRRTPNLTMSADFYVERVENVVNPGTGWTVNLVLFPAEVKTPWILGDATNGVLGTTTIPEF